MSSIGDREITTQRRVIRFSPDTLDYRYLGDWKDREENSIIEEALLTESLNCQGHRERVIPPPALSLRISIHIPHNPGPPLTG